MRRHTRVGLGGLALLVSVAAVAAEPAAEPGSESRERLARLAWLAGSWSTAPGKVRFEEHWTRPASNAMLGLARTMAGSRMTFFEYLRIEARPDGVVFVAQPAGGSPTDFRLTSLTEHAVTFENPQHDFPRRIRYRRTPAGDVTARIDGGEGVDEGAIEFAYRPVAPLGLEPAAPPEIPRRPDP